MAYNTDSVVQTLANALAQDANLVGKVWSKQLREGARSVDDFAAFEGGEGAAQPFTVRKDLTANAGDSIRFTTMSQPRGPGVRGETELRGAESSVDFATYECKVDYLRDAVKFTQKQIAFMAAGQGVKSATLKLLREKLGRRRMNDMKMALKLQADGNTIFPNGKKTIATLEAIDTMSPSFLTTAKPQWQRLGGKPFKIGTNKLGSPVYSCMAYIPDCAMTSIRNSNSYEQALLHAADKGGANPLFSGKLLDWNGIGLFEHISTDPENDVLADPLAPRAVLATAFSVDSAAGACKLICGDATDTATPYTAWFGGYPYEWYEGQSSESAWSSFYTAIAARVNYAWIINPSDGSVGFVKWTGSGKNNGNRITLTQILSPDGAGTSTLGSATVGNIDATGDTWDSTPAAGGVGSGNTSADFLYTDSFEAGAYIIPCNANGVPEIASLLMGQDTAVRAYVGDDVMIEDKDDYGFVTGGGYSTIFGQAPCERTDGKTMGYSLLWHAGQHSGLEVPSI